MAVSGGDIFGSYASGDDEEEEESEDEAVENPTASPFTALGIDHGVDLSSDAEVDGEQGSDTEDDGESGSDTEDGLAAAPNASPFDAESGDESGDESGSDLDSERGLDFGSDADVNGVNGERGSDTDSDDDAALVDALAGAGVPTGEGDLKGQILGALRRTRATGVPTGEGDLKGQILGALRRTRATGDLETLLHDVHDAFGVDVVTPPLTIDQGRSMLRSTYQDSEAKCEEALDKAQELVQELFDSGALGHIEAYGHAPPVVRECASIIALAATGLVLRPPECASAQDDAVIKAFMLSALDQVDGRALPARLLAELVAPTFFAAYCKDSARLELPP
jgi:hypothetical protein